MLIDNGLRWNALYEVNSVFFTNEIKTALKIAEDTYQYKWVSGFVKSTMNETFLNK